MRCTHYIWSSYSTRGLARLDLNCKKVYLTPLSVTSLLCPRLRSSCWFIRVVLLLPCNLNLDAFVLTKYSWNPVRPVVFMLTGNWPFCDAGDYLRNWTSWLYTRKCNLFALWKIMYPSQVSSNVLHVWLLVSGCCHPSHHVQWNYHSTVLLPLGCWGNAFIFCFTFR